MIKYLILIAVLFLLIYTRVVNLSWGLPYPFHPDERNMAVAIQQFTCDQPQIQQTSTSFLECLNPKFFAYGQFPLYISYLGIQASHWIKGEYLPTSFYEAIMSLRIISAVSSILTVIFLVQIVKLLLYRLKILNSSHKKKYDLDSPYTIALVSSLVFIFSPVLIQFAHFGTTESLLIFFYVLLLYFSIKALDNVESLPRYLTIAGIICGLAIATKVSAVIYAVLPIYIILHDRGSGYNLFTRTALRFVVAARFVITILVIGLICSPYNLLAITEFMGSFQYESSVALGKMNVFYTRQFQQTIPILFQFKSIFPYVLGPAILFLFIAGFFFLPWKNRYMNLLRVSFLLAFVPNAFMYAKWTRFIAPAYPIMLLIAVLFLQYLVSPVTEWLKDAKSVFRWKNMSVPYILFVFLFFCFILLSIIPGVAYLTIYRDIDVRFRASEWIYSNMRDQSYIFSETANVVDLPIPSPERIQNRTDSQLHNYQYISFNFYDLDTEPPLQSDFNYQIKRAEYIFVPSRRIFMNHTCITVDHSKFKIPTYMNNTCAFRMSTYPLLNQYYMDLFSGKMGFTKVAEFSSYPRIELFGTTLLEFPDENAEETWTVFDHPVIRIYKKNSPGRTT